jgi:hypothetical protein
MKAKFIYPAILLFAVMSIISSCKKDASSTSKTSSTSATTTSISARVADGAIVLAASDTAGPGKKDTLYLINCFPPSQQPDTVAASALSSSITTYLSSNYSGYTFQKAFAIDSAKTLIGYVVVIKYNGNFVGLKFTASGTFVKVLEQMMSQDMNNPQGCHPGGPFGDRGQPGRDSVALSALPAAVLSYFDKTYPADTLLHAFVTPDTTYVLISKDKGLFATNVSAAGKLINRMQLMPPMPFPPKPVAQSALPAAIATYLTSTYPGYVFNQAFADMNGNTTVGFDVFITVNSTNYMVHFDASGNYVSAVTLH